MASDRLEVGLFPVPLSSGTIERDGLLFRRSQTCAACSDESCKRDSEIASPKLCVQGVNYYRVNEHTLVRGIFFEDWEPSERDHTRSTKQAFKRNRREQVASGVRLRSLLRYIRPVRAVLQQHHSAFVAAEEGVFHERYSSRDYEGWAKQQLEVATKGLSRELVHDLLQLVAAAMQNSTLVFTQRYGDPTAALGDTYMEERLLSPVLKRKVWHREKSIYHICELLTLRLKFARLFLEGDVVRRDDWQYCSPHKMFVKIVRMFEALAEEKGVSLSIEGESRSNCFVQYDLLHVPALALVENAVKYAPDKSKVRVRFDESDSSVEVAVESLGPKIDEDEKQAIFAVGYRGRQAKDTEESGAGLGLWQARRAVEQWGQLSAHQESQPVGTYAGYHMTTFTLLVSKDIRKQRLNL